MSLNVNDQPKHVAIIMDGNSRWAKQNGLPRLEGHQAGAKNVRHVVEVFAEYNIDYLTLFAFSTENWGRPRTEVKSLLRIFEEMIDSEIKTIHEKDIRLFHLGQLSRLPEGLQRKVKGAIELTRNNTGMTLSIAFDYGGRTEILDTFRRLLTNGVSPEKLDEVLLRGCLYAPELPDPDLIIRTGGEMRLSNFFLWQAAYSELYFTNVLWPDFNGAEIDKALAIYVSRQRRFGTPPLRQARANLSRIRSAESKASNLLGQLLQLEYRNLSNNAKLNPATKALTGVFGKADKQSNIIIISHRNHDAEALAFNTFYFSRKGNAVINVGQHTK